MTMETLSSDSGAFHLTKHVCDDLRSQLGIPS